jgi:hypothetical protein
MVRSGSLIRLREAHMRATDSAAKHKTRENCSPVRDYLVNALNGYAQVSTGCPSRSAGEQGGGRRLETEVEAGQVTHPPAGIS